MNSPQIPHIQLVLGTRLKRVRSSTGLLRGHESHHSLGQTRSGRRGVRRRGHRAALQTLPAPRRRNEWNSGIFVAYLWYTYALYMVYHFSLRNICVHVYIYIYIYIRCSCMVYMCYIYVYIHIYIYIHGLLVCGLYWCIYIYIHAY